MAGWIALHREALEHPLLRDGDRFRAWCWMIAKAAWLPTPFDVHGRTITLERGQLCASRNQLAASWRWPPSKVERFLTRLETELMIGRETGQGRTIITICNYTKYQGVTGETGQGSGQRPDKHRITKEPRNYRTSSGDKSPSPRARGAPRRDGLPDNLPVPPELWTEFREHRRSVGAPLTPQSETRFIARLEKLRQSGHDPKAVLQQTIDQGWRGVFPLKADNGGRTGQSRNGLFDVSGPGTILDGWMKDE